MTHIITSSKTASARGIIIPTFTRITSKTDIKNLTILLEASPANADADAVELDAVLAAELDKFSNIFPSFCSQDLAVFKKQ
jgi:hypothetical protein